MPRRSGLRPGPRSTRRSSASATGWTSRATTSCGISARTTRCSSTPPPISPGRCFRRRLPAVRPDGARAERRRRANGSWSGSTISRQFEMAEWNSAPYFPIDFKGLAALFALAPDADIRERAGRGDPPPAGDRRALQPSGHAHGLAGAQLRAFAAALPHVGASAVSRLFFGRGWLGTPLPCAAAARPLPSATTGCGRRRADRACGLGGTGALEWTFRQGATASPRSIITRPAIMPWDRSPPIGLANGAIRRPCCTCASASGRKRRSGSTIPASGSFPASRGRPIWGGCGTLPRVHQYRDLAVLDFELTPGQVDFTHAWLPRGRDGRGALRGKPRLCARREGARALIGSAPFERGRGAARPPAARSGSPACGRAGSCACRTSAATRASTPSPRRFRRTCGLGRRGGEICLDDPDYGACRLSTRTARLSEQGGGVDPSTWTHAGHAAVLPGGTPIPLPSHAKPRRMPGWHAGRRNNE